MSTSSTALKVSLSSSWCPSFTIIGASLRAAVQSSNRHQQRLNGFFRSSSAEGSKTTVTPRGAVWITVFSSLRSFCIEIEPPSLDWGCCNTAATSIQTQCVAGVWSPTAATRSPHFPDHACETKVREDPTNGRTHGKSTKRHRCSPVMGLMNADTTSCVCLCVRSNVFVSALRKPTARPRFSIGSGAESAELTSSMRAKASSEVFSFSQNCCSLSYRDVLIADVLKSSPPLSLL
mmetsp:Transcript_20574/g.42177  ORF Transcript_20574/g.42177 Transcript_20574/m.42177 type:complete len:234 (-) Transcript_20574:161-862(-)